MLAEIATNAIRPPIVENAKVNLNLANVRLLLDPSNQVIKQDVQFWRPRVHALKQFANTAEVMTRVKRNRIQISWS